MGDPEQAKFVHRRPGCPKGAVAVGAVDGGCGRVFAWSARTARWAESAHDRRVGVALARRGPPNAAGVRVVAAFGRADLLRGCSG